MSNNVGLEHPPERLAPPQEQRDDAAEKDGCEEAEDGLGEGDADVIEEGALRVEGGDRLKDARGGADEEGVCPTEGGDKFPQPDKKQQEPQADGADEKALSPASLQIEPMFFGDGVFHGLSSFQRRSNQPEKRGSSRRLRGSVEVKSVSCSASSRAGRAVRTKMRSAREIASEMSCVMRSAAFFSLRRMRATSAVTLRRV